MNLMAATKVGDAIHVANDMFTQYDKPHISMLWRRRGPM